MPRRRCSWTPLALGVALAGCAPAPRPVADPGVAVRAGADRPAPAVPRRTLEERERDVAARTGDPATRAGGPTPVPSGDVDRDLVAVGVLEAAGRTDDARAALHAVRRAHPADPLARWFAARRALDDGDPAAAAELLDALDAAGAVHTELALLRGLARLAGPEPEDGERLLREELAAGAHPARAAFALCDALTAAERYADARAVIAAARAREPDRPDLRLVEARLRHDVFDLDGAAATLRALAEDRPDLAAPWVQLAEVERARGDRAAGLAALAAMPAGDPWLDGQRGRVAELTRDLGAARGARTARDLLAMVRGTSSIAERLDAFDALVGVDQTRDAAIRVAFAQPDAVLRVRAIRAIPAADPGLADDLAVAAADPDPRVRGTAVRRSAGLADAARALALAREALAADEDPYVFRAAHDALTARLGPLVALPPGGEHDVAVRRQTTEAWRRACPE